MNRIIRKFYSYILLNVIGKKNISEIVDMYEVSSSIRILENDFGHILSIQKQLPVNNNNEPLPWFTYPAIEYVSQFNLSEKIIFEWGSGNSSSFFARRAKKIYSVEDNRDWFEKNSKQKKTNQEIYFAEDSEYINSISKLGIKFDIIIIDGKYRYECGKVAPGYLNMGGCIILDNSDWYKNTAKHLRDRGLIQVDFHGFGPVNQYNWTTSIFFQKDFNFKTFYDEQPSSPIGCLEKKCD
ncbi:MAG: SAM-dependent methyltransferase [Actinobacteria bacterium]|nr:SAM-dependent methyltransferase [Actinomycetota bacterium]